MNFYSKKKLESSREVANSIWKDHKLKEIGTGASVTGISACSTRRHDGQAVSTSITATDASKYRTLKP